MKNNFTSSKKPKIGFVALLLFFCVLWGNGAMGQTTYTWIKTSGTWGTPGNWSTVSSATLSATTVDSPTVTLSAANANAVVGAGIIGAGIPAGATIISVDGTGLILTISSNATATAASVSLTYRAPSATAPGNASTDFVVINNGGTPTLSTTVTVARVTVTNSALVPTGSILTIDSNGKLNVTSTSISNVILAGGNIVNDGELNITTINAAGAANIPTGITCNTPSVTGSNTFNYSGSGKLDINISGYTTTSGAGGGIVVAAVDPLATYRFLFNGQTTFTLLTTAASNAIRANGGTNASSLIIGGTGFTLGTAMAQVRGGLLVGAGQSKVTIESGTTLTLNSASGNLSNGLAFGNGATSFPTFFTNGGTINILGTTARNGINVNIGTASASNDVKINIVNNGVINVDINAATASAGSPAVAYSAYNATVGSATSSASPNGVIFTNNGIVSFKNSATGTGLGFPIWGSSAGQRTNTTFTNNGTLNIEGTTAAVCQGFALINNAVVNSNSGLNGSPSVINNSNGSINFSKSTAIPATFTVSLAAAATAGAVYTDANSNNYIVSTTKITGTGLSLATNVDQIAAVPASGTLNLSSGTGDASIAYSTVATTPNALTATTTTNSGTINTGKGGTLSVLTGLLDASPGTIAPGGSEYGIAELNKSGSSTQDGKLKIQVGGNTAAGFDYDQMSNISSFSGGSGYTNATITFVFGGGSGATGTATIVDGVITAINITNGGSGYTAAPGITIAGDGTGAAARATITSGVVTGINYNLTTNISSLDLDISYLPTPATSPLSVPIVVVGGVGSTLTGNFANVTGLKAGWALDYTTPNVVNLVYTAGATTAASWTGTTDSDWGTATNWSPAAVPTVSSDVTIPTASSNQPIIGSNVDINSIVIQSGKSLTVNTGFNLSVTDGIANNGSLTIASNANLIQVNDVANSGNITVNRESNALRRLDYTIWSSPVTIAPQLLSAFSPATDSDRFYTYNQTTNFYNAVDPVNTSFTAATGFLIRMPNDHPATPLIWNGSFSGVPNNGTINKAITFNGALFGYNMIGNPYPSTIDAQAFIAANTANIESALYFWRKINGATGSAYAVYNPMGATTASPSSAVPNGTIQVGQGFFVKARSASSVNFTNAMRVANTGNQFFKTRAAYKDRLWVNLTNTTGVFSQALVGYTADATVGVDMYDAKYINDSPIALTSSINGDEYTIQGRPAFDATDVVMLNFKTDAAGDYSIAIDQADGVFVTGQDVYLVDSKTGTETNLKTGAYTFAATAGVDNARFSLKYQKTLAIDTQSFDDNSISVYANNGTLYVNSKSANINNVTVYDVQGRLIAQKVNVKSTTAVINNLRASNQVLIVRIEGEDSSVVTKKLLN